jgi:hypothetical protein
MGAYQDSGRNMEDQLREPKRIVREGRGDDAA